MNGGVTLIVFENDFFYLISDSELLKIKAKKTGFDLKEFSKITISNPTFHITNFTALKDALHIVKEQETTIGVIKPDIEVIISPDKMEAKAIMNISAKSFEENKNIYIAKLVEVLRNHNVVYGIENVYDKPFAVQREIIVAKGTPAVNGLDSEITLYHVHDRKPVIEDDGKVNHYELSLIESVEKGTWLGEMTKPTDGTVGKTVTGESILPKPGKLKKLLFDSKSVGEREENGISVIRALVDGAVRIENGKVYIDNHLMIKGDVNYITGNIHFKGSVTVQGTIQDGFSVVADGDISINSPLGVGAVHEIVSNHGCIYIKGGIYGKYISKIKADKDVFIKHCNEVDIQTKGNINIGYYSLYSNLTAQNVFVDQSHGKIIGGNIFAESRVVSAFVGNPAEKPTFISIKGFDRTRVIQLLSDLVENYKKSKQEVATIRVQLETLENKIPEADRKASPEYLRLKEVFEQDVRNNIIIENEQKKLLQILSTKGEGEFFAVKMVYAKTHVVIKHLNMIFEEATSGVLYVKDGELIKE